MQSIIINKLHPFMAILFLVMLGILCWMLARKSPRLLRVEQKIAQFIQQKFGQSQMNYADGALNSILTFLATYGSPTFISILTVFIGLLFFLTVDYGLAIWLLGVVSSGGIFGIFLKNLFKRQRPKEHLPFDDGYAFPSGHAIASTLFFFSLLLVFVPMIQGLMLKIVLAGIICLVWGAILFSRIYFHAHYIGDLFAGVSFGIFWVLTSMYVYNFLLAQWLQYALILL